MKTKELKVYRGNGNNYTPIPQIILQGQWLNKLGFSIGDKVIVTWEEDRLIVEKSENGSLSDKADMVAEPAPKYKRARRRAIRI